jgi:hypothetical protein
MLQHCYGAKDANASFGEDKDPYQRQLERALYPQHFHGIALLYTLSFPLLIYIYMYA